MKAIIYKYQWANLGIEEDTNFEYKILSKQEGQIQKDHNSLSKNQKKPKSNLEKEDKNNVF